MRLAPQHAFELLSHRDATAHHDHVDIVGRALQKDVTHIATYDVTLHPETVSSLADLVEQFLV